MRLKEAYVSYDSDTGLFELTAWVLTTDIVKSSTVNLRDELIALADLAAALIGYEFQEFKDRGAKDLRIQWRLGRSGGDVIAIFENNRFQFTDAYYVYLREIGRRRE